ncbi:hypothetical protein [Marinifilum sp. D737]|uniref:hypothetical protein n=1 Tax=Marinifilum sp. D737 TaxID=2969628 RepID=UPI002275E6C3|nr:hypothetical protein [Marinifilum sp. D737]MCY1633709.1 hypothetical protein [Marinifilum sp. D737]
MNTSDSIEEQKLIQFLNDSIVKHPYGMFYPYEFIDTLSHNIEFKLCFDYDSYLDYEWVKIKHRNVFYVNIDRNNQINSRIGDKLHLDTIKPLFKHFILNKHESEDLPEKRIMIIPLLNTVQVSKGALYVKTQLIPDSTLKRTDWKLIKKVINIASSSIMELRNEGAQFYFDKTYIEASLKEKMALIEYHPIGIWFYPNGYNPKPPTPPVPVLSKEVIKILELIDEAEEELEILEE